MEKLELRCRFTQSDGKHSFQLYNAATGNVIWASPDWWDTQRDAEMASLAVRNRLAADMRSMGLVVTLDENSLDTSVTKTASTGQMTVLAVLAVNQQTGKFGFAVLTSAGEVVFRPERYFDTPAEAFEFAKANRDKVIAMCKMSGIEKINFLELDEADFVPPPGSVEKFMNQGAPAKKSPLPYLRPSHFDPLVN